MKKTSIEATLKPIFPFFSEFSARNIEGVFREASLYSLEKNCILKN